MSKRSKNGKKLPVCSWQNYPDKTSTAVLTKSPCEKTSKPVLAKCPPDKPSKAVLTKRLPDKTSILTKRLLTPWLTDFRTVFVFSLQPFLTMLVLLVSEFQPQIAPTI